MNPEALATIGLKAEDLTSPSDRHMSEALPATVRSIDFREEDPAEFPEGYNTVLWNGELHK